MCCHTSRSLTFQALGSRGRFIQAFVEPRALNVPMTCAEGANMNTEKKGVVEPDDLEQFLIETPLLNFSDDAIQSLVWAREWRGLEPSERIKAVYNFVRDEVYFGYNADDDLTASKVLADGYGQCNTKATLLMALLRAVEIPCRFHAASVYQDLQRGVIPGLLAPLAPKEILHAWVEVPIEGQWIRMEGVILDERYLEGVCVRLDRDSGPVLGFAVGTSDIANPPIHWNGANTEIQMTGVAQDFGAFDDPDRWYAQAGTNLKGLKSLIYRHFVRHRMNRRVSKIRGRALMG
jgi:hypothetical protein